MNRIRELREQKGLQQKELAVDIGISQPTVSDWESGRKIPSAKSTMKLSKYFGVSVEYLMGEEPASHPVIRDEDIRFALFGGDAEITDAQFEEVKRFAQFVKMREEREELGHKR